MSNTIKRLRASLEKMRVPELQRRFEEATGEATRSPNKTFLVRRIIEATEAAARVSRNVDDEAAQATVEPAESDGGSGDGAEARPDASNTQAGEAQSDPAEELPVAAPTEERAHDRNLAEPSSSAAERPQDGEASASQADEDDRPQVLESPEGAVATGVLTDRLQHDAALGPPPDGPNESLTAGGESLPSSDTSMSEAAPVVTSSAAEGAEEGGDEPLVGTAANGVLGDQAAPEDGNQERDGTPSDSAAANAHVGSSRRRGRRAANGAPEAAGAVGEPAEPSATASNRLPRGALTGLTTEELQAKYLEVVGRPTGSSDKPYLMWKIREATKGKIPTGPRLHGRRTSQGDDIMVLPLRLPATTVDVMDDAWHSRGIRTRMDFLREAIRLHLERIGASEAAALLVRSEADAREELT